MNVLDKKEPEETMLARERKIAQTNFVACQGHPIEARGVDYQLWSGRHEKVVGLRCDNLIIQVQIARCFQKRVLTDNVADMNILYAHAFKKMGLQDFVLQQPSACH